MTKRMKSIKHGFRRVLSCWELYLFIVPTLVWFVLFQWIPLAGIQIAFRDYNFKAGVWASKWTGFLHFERFITLRSLGTLLKNTIGISVYSLAVGFPVPILLALVLNELRSSRLKRTVQTVSYAPHFISMVVMVGMIFSFLDMESGIINKIAEFFGGSAVDFMIEPKWFKTVYVLSGVWQNTGWSSIIYISALSGVDYSLHEAAMIDGANRIQRIRHVNLPGILPTIALMFILRSGSLLSVGYYKVYLMQTPLNLEASEVISTYMYKMGLQENQYSFSAAVGLMNTVVSAVLTIGTNKISALLTEHSLW